MSNQLATEDDARFSAPRLPWHPAIEERFKELGVTKASWKVLVEAVFPAAKTADAVVMALGYCAVRKLDPFKRPVHIVPMWDSTRRQMVETVWPGISEIRTTAFRTGQYAGCDEVEEGPTLTQTFKGMVGRRDDQKEAEHTVSFPEWGRVTVYRILNGVRCKFVGPKIYWLETYGREGNTEVPNAMWRKRSHGQFEKCIEAAALRKAFPEEIGNDYSAEEMEGQIIHSPAEVAAVAGPVAPEEDITEAEIIEHSETLAKAQSEAEKKPRSKPKPKADGIKVAEKEQPAPAVSTAEVPTVSGPDAPDEEDEAFDEEAWMLDVRVRFDEAKTTTAVDAVHKMFEDTLETLVGMQGRQQYEDHHAAALARVNAQAAEAPFPGDAYIEPQEPAASPEGRAFVDAFRKKLGEITARDDVTEHFNGNGADLANLIADGDLHQEWDAVLRAESTTRFRELPKVEKPAEPEDEITAFDRRFRAKLLTLATVADVNAYSTETLDQRNAFGQQLPIWKEWRQAVVDRRNAINGIA